MSSLAMQRSLDLPEASHIPADYADVYRTYFPYIVNLVVKVGRIDTRDAEDVAMTILAKFIEKGALEQYDPEYVVERKGVIAKSVFRAFLSSFVCTYVKHYAKMQGKRRVREPFSGDRQSTSVEGTFRESGTWFEQYAPAVQDSDEQDEIDGWILRERIRVRLADEKPLNAQDRCDFVVLFDEMLALEEEYGSVNYVRLAERLGVSKTTTANWIRRLRVIVAEVIGR